jgi:phosphoribosyl-dephospho-CoA transferase
MIDRGLDLNAAGVAWRIGSRNAWHPMDEASSFAARPISRHDFIWINRHSQSEVAERVADADLSGIVRKWLAAARPLIVRQQTEGHPATANRVAAGLPLPPNEGKRRIALTLRLREINRIAHPPLLAAVIPRLPVQWRSPLSKLCRAGQKLGIDLRVFGAVAWQALTDLPYLTSTSDVDLLWRPIDRLQLERGVALLERWEQTSGLQTDGEIVFGDDLAVAWREWLRRDRQRSVLVKQTAGASLRLPSELLELLGSGMSKAPNNASAA